MWGQAPSIALPSLSVITTRYPTNPLVCAGVRRENVAA